MQARSRKAPQKLLWKSVRRHIIFDFGSISKTLLSTQLDRRRPKQQIFLPAPSCQ